MKKTLVPFRFLLELFAVSALDGCNFNRGQGLTMSRSLAVILSATELLNIDFFVFELPHDLGFNLHAIQRWLTNAGIAFTSDKQNFLKAQSRFGFAFAKVHNNLITYSNTILMAAVFENSVHDIPVSCQILIGTIGGNSFCKFLRRP
jgi:hypothetical protein